MGKRSFDGKKVYFSAKILMVFYIPFHTTLWKNEEFSLQFFFRQINSLVTYLVKPLLSRNFCQKCVRENSRNFHTVHTWFHVIICQIAQKHLQFSKCLLWFDWKMKFLPHCTTLPQLVKHSVKITEIHSHAPIIIGKIFVKVTISLSKLLIHLFSDLEKYFVKSI